MKKPAPVQTRAGSDKSCDLLLQNS